MFTGKVGTPIEIKSKLQIYVLQKFRGHRY